MVLLLTMLAQAGSAVASLEYVETKGYAGFDIGPPPGADTAFASELYEEINLFNNQPTGNHQVVYLFTSSVFDFWPVSYSWGELGAGISIEGRFFALGFAQRTRIEWTTLTRTDRASIGVRSAPAKVTVECYEATPTCKPTTYEKDVNYHYLPNARVGTGSVPSPRASDGSGPAAVGAPIELYNRLGEVSENFDGSETASTYVEFFTAMQPYDDGRAEYRYDVINHLDQTVSFSWAAAGLGGELEPQARVSRRFFGPDEVREIGAAASVVFLQDGTQLEMNYVAPARLLAPVPLPAAAWLLLSVVPLLPRRRGSIG